MDSERIHEMLRMAVALRKQGLAPSEMAAAIFKANTERCRPPLSNSELRGIVRDANHMAFTNVNKQQKKIIHSPENIKTFSTYDHVANYLADTGDYKWFEGAGFYKWTDDGYWLRTTDTEIDQEILNIMRQMTSPNINTNFINQVRRILQLGVRDEISVSDSRYVNFRNCMLDIYNKKTIPHDKNVFTTFQVKADFPFLGDLSNMEIDSSFLAKACPRFLEFLGEITNGDEELIWLISEMFGACLIADSKYQCAFFLHGKGRNGKSVMLKILEAMVGSINCSHVSFGDLANSNCRAQLLNKLVNISTEIDFSEVSSTEYFKAIVSGDTIQANYRYKDEFDFKPFCLLLFACNELPMIRERTYAFYRRLKIIPFDNIIEKSKVDKNLERKLLQEMDGIVYFTIIGMYRLIKNEEFTISKRSTEKLERYQLESSSAVNFVTELCMARVDAVCDMQSTYASYRNWASDNGYRPVARSKFESELREYIPYFSIQSRHNRYEYCGIQPKSLMSVDEKGNHYYNSII